MIIFFVERRYFEVVLQNSHFDVMCKGSKSSVLYASCNEDCYSLLIV